MIHIFFKYKLMHLFLIWKYMSMFLERKLICLFQNCFSQDDAISSQEPETAISVDHILTYWATGAPSD